IPRAEVSPPGPWPRFWFRGFASRRGRRPGCGGPPPAKAGFSGGSSPRTEASRPNPLAVFRIPLGRDRQPRSPLSRPAAMMPSMTNWTAMAARRRPMMRPNARVPVRPILRKIRSALCSSTKAGIVKPNPAKIHWPKTAKTPRVTVAVRQAFETICCFWKASRSSVRTEKKGTTPSGSTIAKMEAMAVAPNAQSTMVFLGFGRSVLPHQLHPAAALVHGEVAAVRGPHEFVPGDHLELVAGALGKAQRARANHLARLEPLDGGDLPCVLERDLLQCRHVPSLSACHPYGSALTAVRHPPL